VKQCPECARNGEGPKPLSDFNRSTQSKDGLQSWCRACLKQQHAKNREVNNARNKKWREDNLEKMLAFGRKWRKRNPIAVTAKSLRQEYGLTLDAYQRIYDEQNGRCAICVVPITSQITETRNPDRTQVAHVDHCHETNVVRGLLCFHCNVGLGKFKDSATNLLAAARYLTATRTPAQSTSQVVSQPQTETLQGEKGPASRDPDRAQAGARRRVDELSPF
jgi:hypothetical protein